MQKLQKLTPEQIKLIEDNYDKIVNLLNKFLNNKKKRSPILQGKSEDLVAEAISYIPDVTIEYNKEMAKSVEYYVFATYRSILRLLDEYRKHIKIKSKESSYQFDLGILPKINSADLHIHIDQESHKLFPNSGDPKKNRINNTFKKLIKEYIIPKLENKKHKSLSQIANENGYTVGMVTYMLNNQKIKNLVNKILN
jgi:hypothetical protein